MSFLRKYFDLLFVCGVQTWILFNVSQDDWNGVEGHAQFIHLVQTLSKNPLDWMPSFSFFYNRGTYLLQDPQSFITSPVSQILVLVFGPQIGIHLYGVFWVFLGWIGMVRFLKVVGLSEGAARVAALGWSLSLGFFWRAVAGHLAFYLHFGLPWFLIFFNKILERPSLKSALVFGMMASWYIWEPGFHSLFYLICPSLVLWMVCRYEKAISGRFLVCSLFTGVVFLILSAPKVFSWNQLPMGRGADLLDGVLKFKDVIYWVFATSRAHLMGVLVPGSNPPRHHFIWEANVAVFFPHVLLALVGVFWGWRRNRILVRFSILAVFLGIALSSSATLWALVQKMTSQGVRVPSRTLALSAFGIAIISGFGFEYLRVRVNRLRRMVFLLPIVTCLLALDWIYRADRNGIFKGIQNISEFDRQENKMRLDYFCPIGGGCPNPDDSRYPIDEFRPVREKGEIFEAQMAKETTFSLQKTELSHKELKVVGENLCDRQLVMPFRQPTLGLKVFGRETGALDPLKMIRLDFPEPVKKDCPRIIELQAKLPVSSWVYWVCFSGWVAGLVFLGRVGLLGSEAKKLNKLPEVFEKPETRNIRKREKIVAFGGSPKATNQSQVVPLGNY